MEPLSLETSRLHIRRLELDDAGFIYRLVNDPDWLSFIGDKNVSSLDDARHYIETGPMAMYREHGFGLNRVALKDIDEPIGICGILQRETLAYPDLGFALLPEFRCHGYALEAARAIIEHAITVLEVSELLAIVQPANKASIGLLENLGFESESKGGAQAEDLSLITYHYRRPT